MSVQVRVAGADPLEVHRIATAVLSLDVKELRHPLPRGDGERAVLRVLVAAGDHMTAEHTATLNALIALARVVNLGIDARRAVTSQQVTEVSRWHTRDEQIGFATARTEAVCMAKQLAELDGDIAANTAAVPDLVRQSRAAVLLERTGIGPVTAAIALTVWSHPRRVRSEAAFAALAGTGPIPASSGNTVRQRLNRGGDRRLNRAPHIATITRMTLEPATRAYVEKRRTEGRTTKEIRRCLKRYLTRRLYRHLNKAATAILGVDGIKKLHGRVPSTPTASSPSAGPPGNSSATERVWNG